METIRDRRSLWAVLAGWRDAGERIAIVPTMGNLHEGHLSLVRTARDHCERVITSIYVNPAQFGEGEDFDSYPRTLDEDVSKLEAMGCDLCFAPDSDQLYPFGLDRCVMVKASPDLAGRLEGRCRPGHFDGVVTVVARLFAIVRPDVAVFGEKDYQQLLVIRRMTDDLGFDVEIIGVRTVRAESGLALSSRNAYLEAAQLRAAEQMNRILAVTADRAGDRGADLESLEQEAGSNLEDAGLEVQYVAIRRSDDLSRPEADDTELRILAAAWCGSTRLIDNMPVPCRPGNSAPSEKPVAK